MGREDAFREELIFREKQTSKGREEKETNIMSCVLT
jgi:hypothetical protein